MKQFNFKVKMNYKNRSGKDVVRELPGKGDNVNTAFENLKKSYCGKDIEGNYICFEELVISEKISTATSLNNDDLALLYEMDVNGVDSIFEKAGYTRVKKHSREDVEKRLGL